MKIKCETLGKLYSIDLSRVNIAEQREDIIQKLHEITPIESGHWDGGKYFFTIANHLEEATHETDHH